MISVCLPYWKRQRALDRMFVNYRDLYPDLPLEFSVCDDGSPTPAVVPEECILTRLPEKKHALNPCVPINRAVNASSGEVIVITNAEVQHRTPILREMLDLLGVGDVEWDRYVVASCYDTRGVWLAGPRINSAGRENVPPGGYFHFLAMLTRSLWDRVGGFDEDYRNGKACDDNDFLWLLQRPPPVRLAIKNHQMKNQTINTTPTINVKVSSFVVI